MLRYLRLNCVGDDVVKWQNFLLGIRPCSVVVASGNFDQITHDETKLFQSAVGFVGKDVDGVVGSMTYAKAGELGFHLALDDESNDDSPNWPVKPPNISSLSIKERENLFGKFSFKSNPVNNNPEAITILGDWVSKNITSVYVPQLKNVKYTPTTQKVLMHSLLTKQTQDMFVAWESAGVLDRILTWGGSWNPRFIRGSRTTLSNHAWGTAFDINVQWNMLGTMPALKGKKGSVRDLVEIALAHGFFWGGWWSSRPDGMHFECYKVL